MIIIVTSRWAQVLRGVVTSEIAGDCPQTDLIINRLIYETVNDIFDIFLDPAMAYTARHDEFSTEINEAVFSTIDEVCRLITPIDPSLIQQIRLMDSCGSVAVRTKQEYRSGAFLRPLRQDRELLESRPQYHRRQFSTGPDYWYLGPR